MNFLPFSRRSISAFKPFCRLAAASVFALTGLSGCDDQPTSAVLMQRPSTLLAQDPGGDLVTTDPHAFADQLRRISNENEVMVLLKDATVPPISGGFLRGLPLGANLVVAVRDVPAGTTLRARPGLARAGTGAGAAVEKVLETHGIQPYRADVHALALRIPDEKLVPVLAALLHHPNVDYVEANQKRMISLNGTPVGSNPADIKHTFHNILDAWDYTRGAGVRVGVLDSGFAGDYQLGTWHPDGQLLSPSSGIQKLGFVDDYDWLNNCDANGSQPYGNCPPWDDNYHSVYPGHGTEMVGLVGANDNSIGYVGVMPEGLTISLKITQNDNVSGSGCGSGFAYCGLLPET